MTLVTKPILEVYSTARLTTADIPVDELKTSRAYFVIVVVTTVDTVVNDPKTPTIFNPSDSLVGISLSIQGKTNQQILSGSTHQ